jgi:hypothetical protein
MPNHDSVSRKSFPDNVEKLLEKVFYAGLYAQLFYSDGLLMQAQVKLPSTIVACLPLVE